MEQSSRFLLTDLPPEVIHSIVSYINEPNDLFHTMLMCKALTAPCIRELWTHPLLSTYDDLQGIIKILNSDHCIMPYHKIIRRLKLDRLGKEITDEDLIKIAKCTSLDYVHMPLCQNIKGHGLQCILVRNSKISHLDLTDGMNIKCESLSYIGRCTELLTLTLTRCINLDDNTLYGIVSKCPNLRRLDVKGCDLITWRSIEAVTRLCPLLKSFSFGNIQFSLPAEMLETILIRLTTLRELNLSLIRSLSNQTLSNLPVGVTFRKLRIIDLSGCSDLSDQGVLHIVQSAPCLSRVSLGKCNLTDKGLSYLSKLASELHLVSLAHCTAITDEGVNVLVRSCTRIRYLDFTSCIHLTDNCVRSISELPKLRRLGLVRCGRITDTSLYFLRRRTFAENTLERLHLSYCERLSIPGLLELLNCAPRLRHISLTGIPAFMRRDIIKFSRTSLDGLTQHQRQLFCVIIGEEVKALRNYLQTISMPTGPFGISFDNDVEMFPPFAPNNFQGGFADEQESDPAEGTRLQLLY
ncbi:hypothetical protein CANCADRAFT_30926 [Tortispora caseinolytica NRRL Y-17796]|uniref:F-box domain-containing protein n=1 Tax=Tortispora caseinolytica NRRL Y-17796 TaxID=767744 RepID=A0A1E4TMC6_9ASCO|nr:hypothetical protein CANCADRAFT_30926 [Tortispora caseinolytica NRRL Y-17796]